MSLSRFANKVDAGYDSPSTTTDKGLKAIALALVTIAYAIVEAARIMKGTQS